MRRSVVILIAWAMGWLVYMIAMVMTVYDGVLSLLFQPIMAAFFSAAFVGIALLIGLILRIPAISRAWRSSRLIAVGLAALSVFLMLFGSSMGLTQTLTDYRTGSHFVSLHWAVAFGSYFVLLFAIANFPLRKAGAP